MTLLTLGTPTAGTFLEHTSEATTSPAYPSSVSAGSVAYLFVAVKAATTSAGPVTSIGGSTVTMSGGAGSTADGLWVVYQAGGTGGTTAPGLCVAIKKNCTGSEGSTTVAVAHLATGPCVAGIVTVSNADTTNPEDVARNSIDASGSTTAFTGVTPVTAGDTIIVFATQNSSNTDTVPSGYTKLVGKGAGTVAYHIAYKASVPTSATGTVTITWSGSTRNLGYMTAVKPGTAPSTQWNIPDGSGGWLSADAHFPDGSGGWL